MRGQTDRAHDAALKRIRKLLRDSGASEDDIRRAERDDLLDLLVADRLLVPSEARYDEAEVARVTGTPIELNRKFWRALGFPDPTPDEKMFTDLDIKAIKDLESMVTLGLSDVDTLLQQARVIGSSMARIADAQVSPAMVGMFSMPESDDSVEAADHFARIAHEMLPVTASLLEFVWRRHVQAAIRRAMTRRTAGRSAGLPELCVGFADMVGFTILSQQLSEEELGVMVSRFEDVAHDVVTARGGRVVKMIGDEAMFVTESLTSAANIALALAETYADDEMLSDVKVALAVGPVLVQDGDYYGPVVNLANRMADIAAPGSVLVTDEFHGRLLEETGASSRASREHDQDSDDGSSHNGGYAFSALRPRVLKDVGRVQLWSLYRPGAEPHRLDRRIGRRWERLSEAVAELEDLRERGEKLISSGLRVATQVESASSAVVRGLTDGTRPGAEEPVRRRRGSRGRAAEGGDTEGA